MDWSKHRKSKPAPPPVLTRTTTKLARTTRTRKEPIKMTTNQKSIARAV